MNNLLLLLYICSIYYCLSFNYPNNTDFSKYRNEIKRIILSTQNIPEVTNTSQSYECVMPKSSIMVTYLSYHLKDFLLLQRKAMEVWNMRECLESRMLTVCTDQMCIDVCTVYNIKNCILLELNFPPSDFKQSAYEAFTYLKYELAYEALQVTNYYFMFDIDIIIFKNPWIHVMYNFDGSPSIYDFRGQNEMGTVCGNEGKYINSGQMFIRNSSKANLFLMQMLQLKDEIVNKKEQLDQDYILPILRRINMTLCQLPEDLYINGCYIDGDGWTYFSSLISWHATCLTGVTMKSKKMMHFYLKMIEYKRNVTELIEHS